MIYFDNAATSFPKPDSVIKEVEKCLRKYCGNPGRGSHSLAMKSAAEIYRTREIIADFIGIKNPEKIIFCHNSTTALNIAIKGLYTPNCHVITSDIEHNSVLRPIYDCINNYGGEISFFDSGLSPEISIPPLINSNTHLLVSTLSSNVNGKIIDFKKLSEIAEKYGLMLIIDATQYIGHRNLDVSEAYYSVLCSAGHKSLFGIQGSAFMAMSDDVRIKPLLQGGSGIDSFSKTMPELTPERFEAGTLSTPAIVSLAKGIEFINDVGIDAIQEKITSLDRKLTDVLLSIPDIKLYGVENGTGAFNFGDYTSAQISNILDKYEIATRSGYHCAPTAHQKLGTTKTGAVRVSFSYFNRNKEIDTLYKALKSIKKER